MSSDGSRAIKRGKNPNQVKSAGDFIFLSHQILQLSDFRLRRSEFLKRTVTFLVNFSYCDELELRLGMQNEMLLCRSGNDIGNTFRMETKPCKKSDEGICIPCEKDDNGLEKFCEKLLNFRFRPDPPLVANNGSICISDIGNKYEFHGKKGESIDISFDKIIRDCQSLAIMPFNIDEKNRGMLVLKSKTPEFFSFDEVAAYEEIGHILGMTISHRQKQVALRERIKELTCLYGIARLASNPARPIEDILRESVRLLPPGWLHPEIAAAQIELDGRKYVTAGFDRCVQKISADIISAGARRGKVEVGYVKVMPPLDEGAFLHEERDLIDAIANEIALIIERRQAEEEKLNLQEQLRHADRLATIGQLAAGVAHELNEPLGSILGFAQLAAKDPETPSQVTQDLGKIEAASLHAREIVKKMMLFARQEPTRKKNVDLNQVISESLFLLESRCSKAGINLSRILPDGVPKIHADAGQLSQVLVNLVVNAIQAMPDGGNLTIETGAKDNNAILRVTDTGIGMKPDVIDKIFIPFYTTKDIDEGTGLGLAVVHGIVTSHGGTITVESEYGEGAVFTVTLPIATDQQIQTSGENNHGRG